MGRETSDEWYVLDLCDEALGAKGRRQHRFDWLLGDPNRLGRRAKLPVDGYWPEAKLVVEYHERQHGQAVDHFDKPDRLTVSGVNRREQRALYDKRRSDEIPKHDLELVIILASQLDATPRGRLKRNRELDLTTIRELLAGQPNSVQT